MLSNLIKLAGTSTRSWCNVRTASIRPFGSAGQDNLTIELQKNYGEETIEKKRSRLSYQSRKRGMLENDLLLGCFANKYLDGFDARQLDEYDHLINKVSNDWDLYYWAVGKARVPDEFNNSVFKLFKEFSSNDSRESRITQPPLH